MIFVCNIVQQGILMGKERTRKKRSVKIDSISSIEIQWDPPVVGCKIEPIVRLHLENGETVMANDDELCYRWHRSEKRLCSNRCKKRSDGSKRKCTKIAKIQCVSCEKLNISRYVLLCFFCLFGWLFNLQWCSLFFVFCVHFAAIVRIFVQHNV